MDSLTRTSRGREAEVPKEIKYVIKTKGELPLMCEVLFIFFNILSWPTQNLCFSKIPAFDRKWKIDKEMIYFPLLQGKD